MLWNETDLKQWLNRLNIDNQVKQLIINQYNKPNSSYVVTRRDGPARGIGEVGDDLCYVQGVSYSKYCLIDDKVGDHYSNPTMTQDEAEEIMLKYVKPKFNNPKIHVFNTELTHNSEAFIGYSWPLEAVAEKLQEKDMRFFHMGFDED